ncbi:hypothetical protein HGA92_02515 [Candidatus Gracilibacteria bacterium]|nr:hypothetical protein [Candidatus Gracilibacteria bacterium]NUJ99355.1 hypothetical protein [Candidatus Gracilibacteria bacterium]
MKKIIFVLVFLIFLSSCGTKTTTSTSLVKYEGEGFSLSIPTNWVDLTQDKTALPKPSSGDIALALASSEFQNGFSNNLLILKDELNYETSSKEFSTLNNIGATEQYSEYEEVEKKEITFADKDNSILYIFDARYNDRTPKLRFLQSAHICDGKKSFFLTIALPMNITEASRYEDIIKSFKCE